MSAFSAAARDLPPINAARDVTQDAASTLRAKRLAAAGASMAVDPRYGVPVFFSVADNGTAAVRLAKSIASKAGLSVERAARAHLTDFGDLYAITGDEIAALPVHDVQRFADGAALVRFRGAIDGIEVFREEANVLLGPQRELVAIGGFAMGAPAKRRPADAALLRPEAAAALALADFGFGPAVALRMQASPLAGDYVALRASAGTTASDGGTLSRDVRAKRVWFRVGQDLVPAYYLEVAVREHGARPHTDHYAYVVAADDGRLLFRRNQVAHVAYTYRVFAEPTAPYLPFPGPAGPRRVSPSDRPARRLSASIRDAEPRHARECSVQPQRSVAGGRRNPYDRKQCRCLCRRRRAREVRTRRDQRMQHRAAGRRRHARMRGRHDLRLRVRLLADPTPIAPRSWPR